MHAKRIDTYLPVEQSTGRCFFALDLHIVKCAIITLTLIVMYNADISEYSVVSIFFMVKTRSKRYVYEAQPRCEGIDSKKEGKNIS